METTVSLIAGLLQEAAELHHRVYRIADGNDPDWASWYADWLPDLSEFPQLLDMRPIRSHLVCELVRLDREYTSKKPAEAWPIFYARGLSAAFKA